MLEQVLVGIEVADASHWTRVTDDLNTMGCSWRDETETSRYAAMLL